MRKHLPLVVVCLSLAACNPAPAPAGGTSSSSSSSSSLSSAVSSAVPVADLLKMEWKTFASDTFGYSVDLPASFAVVTGNREAANVQFMMPRQPQHLIVHIVESSDSLAAYLAAKDEGDKTNYEGKPSSEVLASSATTIDSHDAVVRREMWNAAGFEAVALYVKSGDRVYQFAVYDSGSMGVDAALLSFAERVFASLDWK